MSVSSQAIAPVEDSLSSASSDQASRSSGLNIHSQCSIAYTMTSAVPINPPLLLPRSIRTLFCSTSSIRLLSHRRSLTPRPNRYSTRKTFRLSPRYPSKSIPQSPCSTPLSLSALPPSLASPTQALPPPQPAPSPA